MNAQKVYQKLLEITYQIQDQYDYFAYKEIVHLHSPKYDRLHLQKLKELTAKESLIYKPLFQNKKLALEIYKISYQENNDENTRILNSLENIIDDDYLLSQVYQEDMDDDEEEEIEIDNNHLNNAFQGDNNYSTIYYLIGEDENLIYLYLLDRQIKTEKDRELRSQLIHEKYSLVFTDFKLENEMMARLFHPKHNIVLFSHYYALNVGYSKKEYNQIVMDFVNTNMNDYLIQLSNDQICELDRTIAKLGVASSLFMLSNDLAENYFLEIFEEHKNMRDLLQKKISIIFTEIYRNYTMNKRNLIFDDLGLKLEKKEDNKHEK